LDYTPTGICEREIFSEINFAVIAARNSIVYVIIFYMVLIKIFKKLFESYGLEKMCISMNIFGSVERPYALILRVKKSNKICVSEDSVYYIAMRCECVQPLG
jgi:hypothetical protein